MLWSISGGVIIFVLGMFIFLKPDLVEFEEFQNSFYMRKSCDFRNDIFDNLLLFKYEIIMGS